MREQWVRRNCPKELRWRVCSKARKNTTHLQFARLELQPLPLLTLRTLSNKLPPWPVGRRKITYSVGPFFVITSLTGYVIESIYSPQLARLTAMSVISTRQPHAPPKSSAPKQLKPSRPKGRGGRKLGKAGELSRQERQRRLNKGDIRYECLPIRTSVTRETEHP